MAQLTAAAAATRRSSQAAQAATSRQLAQSRQEAAQSQRQAAESRQQSAELQQKAQLAETLLQSSQYEQARLQSENHALTLEQAQSSAPPQNSHEDVDLQRALTQSLEDEQLRTVLGRTTCNSASRDHSNSSDINGDGHRNGRKDPSSRYTGQTVIRLTSDSFQELLRAANSALTSSVVDGCGRVYRYNGSGSTTIVSSGVTLRNATIHLAQGPTEKGPSLCVKGCGVLMEAVTICGGEVGLWVDPGGDVTMKKCQVRDAYIGIWVGGTGGQAAFGSSHAQQEAHLLAVGLKVSGCSKGSGIGVGSGGIADLRDCEISGGAGCGILVCGDVPGQLTANDVRCTGNIGEGVVVKAGGQAVMTHCSITGNRGGSVLVRGQSSTARLQSCEMDVAGAAVEGGKLCDGTGGWMQKLLNFVS